MRGLKHCESSVCTKVDSPCKILYTRNFKCKQTTKIRRNIAYEGLSTQLVVDTDNNFGKRLIVTQEMQLKTGSDSESLDKGLPGFVNCYNKKHFKWSGCQNDPKCRVPIDPT